VGDLFKIIPELEAALHWAVPWVPCPRIGNRGSRPYSSNFLRHAACGPMRKSPIGRFVYLGRPVRTGMESSMKPN